MRDKGKLPKLSRQARRADPHQLGVDRRRRAVQGGATISTSPTAWRSRRRSTRPRTRTSNRCRYGKGSNAMGLLQTLMTDGRARGHRRAALEAVLRSRPAQNPRKHAAAAQSVRRWSERTMIALVMQHLDNSITTFTKRDEARLPPVDQQAGPRRAEPDVDPGRQRGDPADRREDRRRRRRHLGRAVQHPADRALPRRRGDRRQPADTASSTRTSGCTATRRCRGRRRGDLGESRCESVAFDHRPGRARGVAVAEQGRGRICGPSRASPTGGSTRSRRSIRWCPRTRPGPCGGLPIEPVSSAG